MAWPLSAPRREDLGILFLHLFRPCHLKAPRAATVPPECRCWAPSPPAAPPPTTTVRVSSLCPGPAGSDLSCHVGTVSGARLGLGGWELGVQKPEALLWLGWQTDRGPLVGPSAAGGSRQGFLPAPMSLRGLGQSCSRRTALPLPFQCVPRLPRCSLPAPSEGPALPLSMFGGILAPCWPGGSLASVEPGGERVASAWIHVSLLPMSR